MDRFKLYQDLKMAGFPQGGTGTWLIHPDSSDKVYVPQPSEVYTAFLGDPKDWSDMVDAMVTIWLQKQK